MMSDWRGELSVIVCALNSHPRPCQSTMTEETIVGCLCKVHLTCVPQNVDEVIERLTIFPLRTSIIFFLLVHPLRGRLGFEVLWIQALKPDGRRPCLRICKSVLWTSTQTTSGVASVQTQSQMYPGNKSLHNFSTLLFWKTTILSSKLQCSTAAVVSREKTSRTSKRDSWSQLKCNLSNPVIWRSKGFPLSVSSLSRLCCGPVWASVCACVCVCIYMFVCLHAWVQSKHNLGGRFGNRGISFSWRLFAVKRRIMGKMSRQKDPNLLKLHWETSYSGSLNMKPQGICLDHLILFSAVRWRQRTLDHCQCSTYKVSEENVQ